MSSHDPRLTRLSWAIIAIGVLGIVGASVGLNKSIAAPALLWAASAYAAFWGVTTILYAKFMNANDLSVLARPRVVHIFHGGFFVTNLAFIVGCAIALVIDRDKESKWLYLSLVALIVCEVLIVVWMKTLLRSTATAGSDRSKTRAVVQRLTHNEGIAYIVAMILLGGGVALILSGTSIVAGSIIALIGAITLMFVGFSYLKRLGSSSNRHHDSP